MAMTMDQRIEAAAKRLDEANDWADEWSTEEIVRFVLLGAFPELADGTAWLAPMEPTEAMCLALDSAPDEWPVTREEFRMMRDAHLRPETDAKVEG